MTRLSLMECRRQEAVGKESNLKAAMIEEFVRALESNEGQRLVETVAEGRTVEAKEKALVKLRALVFPAVAQTAFAETGYEGSRRLCGCGKRARHVRNEGKRLSLLVGDVRIERASYRCMSCGNVERPLDERWDIPSGRYSRGVERVASLTGAALPFKRASELLEETTGVVISPRELQSLTERVGESMSEMVAGDIEVSMNPDAATTHEADVLVVAMDGGMMAIREEGWKEVKVAAIQQCRRVDGQTLAKEGTSYTTCLGTAEAFRPRLWAEVVRNGVQGREATIVLGDGAPWIWNSADEVLPGSVQILDWYHLSEHVHTTKRDVYGDASEAGHTWAETILNSLWYSEIDAALDQVATTTGASADARESLEKLVAYITTNRGRMEYETHHRRGYPVGSGVVESACKQVIQARHKQSGMRWQRNNAQRMLDLAAFIRSARWDAYWSARAA